MKARSIDTHAHVVLAETEGAAGAYGPEVLFDGEVPIYRIGKYRLRGVQYRGSAFMDLQVRLKRMDQAGIDVQVLTPNPLTYFHYIEPAAALAFSRIHNDALAAIDSAAASKTARSCQPAPTGSLGSAYRIVPCGRGTRSSWGCNRHSKPSTIG